MLSTLEEKRKYLFGQLEFQVNCKKLIHISSYFDEVMLLKNHTLAQTYISEFFPAYIKLLKSFSSYGKEITLLSKLIRTAENVTKYINDCSELNDLNTAIEKCRQCIANLEQILKGEDEADLKRSPPQFPLINISEKDGIHCGELGSVSVQIVRKSDKDIFSFIPSDLDNKETLEELCSDLFLLVHKSVRKYFKKISRGHEIVIKLNVDGTKVEGNSFGIALTLAFMDALLRYYPSLYQIFTFENIAFTGNFDDSGNAIPLSQKIIEIKTEHIFFSNIKYFLIPKEDEVHAQKKMAELKSIYPDRNLEIVAIKNLDDLLNRRNVTEIRKKNVKERSVQFFRSNAIIVTLSTIIVALLFIYFVYNYDTEPKTLRYDVNKIFVENIAGRVLWEKEIFPRNAEDLITLLQSKMVDINDDGKKEIILTTFPGEINAVKCFDETGEVIWSYFFTDTIETMKDKMFDSFSINIIDTFSINSKKILLLTANHTPLYGSAIFLLDLNSGKRIEGTYYNCGRIQIAKINFAPDSPSIIAIGLNNAFEKPALLQIPIKKIFGCSPTNNGYEFKNLRVNIDVKYLLLPKTDLTIYKNIRLNHPKIEAPFLDNEKNFNISISEGEPGKNGSVIYSFDFNTNLMEINISDEFKMARDALITRGELNPPFSDTKEYFSLLRSQILIWNGSEFVKYEAGK